MPVYTEKLPERKASKHSAIQWEPCPDDFSPRCGRLLIDTDRSRAVYILTEFPTGWRGRGFHLVKVEGGTDQESETYNVFCSADHPSADSCDCKGMTYKRTCKHADACRALIENGWL